jgi:hypothetical protein
MTSHSPPYSPKTRPWAHQVQALECLRGRSYFALLMAMRTGKTKVVLDDFGRLWAAGHVDDLLVIAPAGVYRTWVKAIQEHLGEPTGSQLQVKLWSAHEGASKVAERRWQHFMTPDHHPRCLLINVEALSTVKRARELVLAYCRQKRAYAVIDECFPAGAMVTVPGGRTPIEELRPGDLVVSSTGTSIVKRLLKKESSILVKVALSDGRVIKATPNHPVFTDLGWMCVGNLKEGRMVYGDSSLRGLWSRVQGSRDEEVLREILLSEVEDDASRGQGEGALKKSYREEGKDVQGEREDEREALVEQGHSDEGGVKGEAQSNVKGDEPCPTYQGREREAPTEDSDRPGYALRMAMGTGASHQVGREATRLSNLLQGRSGKPRGEAGHRAGWTKSFVLESQGEGCEEGSEASRARVESVEVEELSGLVNVYDLELGGTPHFFVEDVLVHNSTTIKNPRSRRAKFLVRQVSPLCTARRILTGLVAPRDPGDVFQQFQFLKPGLLGFDDYQEFQSRYAITEEGFGRGRHPGETQRFTKVLGWRDQEKLSATMAPHSFRVRLKDCYDLPPKIYETRDVELTHEQERIYKELREHATVELEEAVHVTATQACVLALRLHQVVCGHVGDEQGIRRTIPTNRLKAVLDILEEWDGDKAIIWCAYDQDIREVSMALGEAHGPGSVARFWGGNRSQREEDEARFLQDCKCKFMVATPQAGGRGRTWSVADLVIYHSNTQDLEAREQSEERAQGVDKTQSVLYVDLVGRFRDGSKTIDSAYLHSLRQKITMAALLMGDGWRDWVI